MTVFYKGARSLAGPLLILRAIPAASYGEVVSIRDGRTSSEFIRRDYRKDLAGLENVGFRDESGEVDLRVGYESDTHEEFVVIDRVGRMQLPREYMDSHGLKAGNKLRYIYEDGRIILEPTDK